MRRHPVLPLLVLSLFGLGWLSGAWAQQKREVTTVPDSNEYLFFLDEAFSVGASVPQAERVKPSESKLEVNSLSVSLTAAPTGIREIPEVRFECQGTTYLVPARRVNVLGPRLEGPGFFMETAPDPNGSGNVEVLVGWNVEGQRASNDISLNYNSRPKGIEVVNSSTSTSFSDKKYTWTMKLVLRNKTGQPYTLPKAFFKDLPELEEWPEVIIPPADVKP